MSIHGASAMIADQLKRINVRKQQQPDAETAPNANAGRFALNRSASDLRERPKCNQSCINFRTANSRLSIASKPSYTRNYSFSNNEMREIERTNQILMQKIQRTKADPTIRRATSSMNFRYVAPSTINRKRQQQQIEAGNDMLQKRLIRISGRRPPPK